MHTVLVVAGIVAYAMSVGVFRSLLYWLVPSELDVEPEYSFVAIFWPIVFPAILASRWSKRFLRGIDDRKASRERETAEQKKRIEDLEKELRNTMAGFPRGDVADTDQPKPPKP